MTFSNLFKRKDKPIDSLRHYLMALENGDRERLLDAVILEDDGRDQKRVLINFALDNIPRMSLLSAKSEGDKISRAFELIDMPGTILALEGVGHLFEDNLISDDQRDLTRALEAMERGEYGTAVELLQPLAKLGKTRAKTVLGLLYAKGNGVEQDYKRAFELFNDSAMHGDDEALYYLGYAYFNGEGVEADQTWALAYLMAADKLGHDRAGQEVEKAVATLENEVQGGARERASSLISEILNRKKAAQIQQTK